MKFTGDLRRNQEEKEIDLLYFILKVGPQLHYYFLRFMDVKGMGRGKRTIIILI